MAVSYDYYRIFYYVAKYRSFTKAARQLMNSQPNITRAINNLEHSLGCRLFLRTHRGVTLTPEGKQLYSHVRIAFEHLLTGEAELTSARNLERGRITIGASETALNGLLLDVLTQFHRTYPGIHIQITNQTTPQAIDAIRSGAVDLAVVTSPAEVNRPLGTDPLRTFSEVLIAGPGFLPLAGQVVPLTALQDYPLIALNPDTKTYQFYSELFSSHGCVFHPDIELATVDQILPLVKHDLGLGFLPRFFAEDAIRSGEVLEITLDVPIPGRTICMIRDHSNPLSAAGLALEQMIRSAADPQFQAAASKVPVNSET